MPKKDTKKILSPSDAILADLTTSQKKAISHTDGPLLIIAGAGTGKTTVITRRIAWLIAQGLAKPDEILALTFTEKASAEMEERVDRLLPLGYVDLWISTFHAFGERILREHAIDIGLDPDFEIMTPSQQWVLLKEHLFDFDLNYFRPLGNPTKFLYALTSHFSRAKDEDVSPADYAFYAEKHAEEMRKKIVAAHDDDERAALEESIVKTNEIAAAYATYEKLLTENGLMDFGDLIINTLHLLRKRKGILAKYRQQFKYILVDEFQDTNYAQYELVKLLAAPQDNLTVVGDDDQSIYKFRGAAISNILAFKEEYPKAAEVVLTDNFRSSQAILDLAYASIQINNPERLEVKLSIDKKLQSRTPQGTMPSLLQYETIEQEVAGVIAKMLEIREKEPEATWDDFAILVRANAHAEPFLKALEQKAIPYEFVASKGLFARPEVMDLVAFLRIVDHHGDQVSFYRLLTSPMFGFAMSDINTLVNYGRQKNLSIPETLQKIGQFIGVKQETTDAAKKLLALITEARELSRRKPVSYVLYKFLASTDYIKKLLQNGDIESTKKVMNINQFFKQLLEFEKRNDDHSVKAFVEELNVLQEAGEDPAPAMLEEGPEAVKVMTLHAAKGLEFPYVFMVNLVDQRFPARRRSELIPLPEALIKEQISDSDAHIAEERRLFYVGITRAKKGLFLVAAADYGGTRKRKLSPLVKEVADHFSLESGNAKTLELALDLSPQPAAPQPTASSTKLPERFSYTQLAAFENCPRQYYYAHVLKIPALGSHTLSYGKSLHNALAEFYKLLQKKKQPTLETLLDLLDRFWLSDWYHSKAHELKQKKQAVETLTKFFEKNAPSFAPPKFIEQPFNLKLGDFTIRGAIDRVDEKADGTIELIDYKTGRLRTQKDADKDAQLSLYALALQKVFNLRPTSLALYFLDEGKKVTTERSDADLIKAEEKIIKTINEIITSDFAPTPGFQCKYCDFLSICEEGQREVGHSG